MQRIVGYFMIERSSNLENELPSRFLKGEVTTYCHGGNFIGASASVMKIVVSDRMKRPDATPDVHKVSHFR